ncbi:MAG TPA: sterol desaturase family protein [Woeseiaceae bacterium]|jgi:hypothetical protein
MTQSAINEARAAFRERRVGPGYSGPRHLATTTTVSLGVALLCAFTLDDVRPLEWLTIPLTFVYANLSEYLGHRGPMHHRKRFLGAVFQRHSIEHHAFFTDEAATFDSSRDYKAVLFPPVLLLFFIGCFAAPIGTILYFLVSSNVAFLFVLTSVLYFLNYELLHFAYHSEPQSWIGHLPLMHRLRRHHIHHHNKQLMTRYNFNITYPLCDYLFGTVYRDPVR